MKRLRMSSTAQLVCKEGLKFQMCWFEMEPMIPPINAPLLCELELFFSEELPNPLSWLACSWMKRAVARFWTVSSTTAKTEQP
jgi:hypothetical protein